MGTSQVPVPQGFIDVYHERSALRVLNRLLSARNPKVLMKSVLSLRTPVFFCVETGKTREWKKGYVVSAQDHILVISKNVEGRGKHLKVAYEGIRLVLETPLLQDLDNMELQTSHGTGGQTNPVADEVDS